MKNLIDHIPMENFDLNKSLVKRFLRGAVAGAISTMIIVAPNSILSWSDVGGWLMTLAIAGVVGSISGGLLALDKYIRS